MSDHQTLFYVLCFVVPIEYAAISFASLVSKIVVVNFLGDLSEASRSRETKQECLRMKANVRGRYKESLLWPLEIWKGLKGEEK